MGKAAVHAFAGPDMIHAERALRSGGNQTVRVSLVAWRPSPDARACLYRLAATAPASRQQESHGPGKSPTPEVSRSARGPHKCA